MSSLRDDLRKTLPLCAAFTVLFAVCYGFASRYAGQQAELRVWDLPLERSIPFLPWVSVLYLSLNPAMLAAPLILRKRSELVPLAVVLAVELLVATAFFLLLPQTTSFERPPVEGWARFPFALADWINLSYNQFPSLHVAFACSVAWAYVQRTRGVGRILWPAWSVAVAASTLFMWEHNLVDIAGGALLAAACMALLDRRLQQRDFQQNVRNELSCLQQCAHFSRRHVRYFVIFVAIYAPSLLHWRRYRAVRYGFCTAQWIDDLLDGDRPSPREPLEIVDELLAEMSSSQFSPAPLSQLTRALFEQLSPASRGEFIALVRTMRRDRDRVLGNEVWSEQELRQHHRATFALSIDLLLATAHCTAQASEVPSLVEALAWCSVFRDLEDDLRKGLINVPRDVWSGDSDGLEKWTRESHDRARSAIALAAGEVEALRDARARRILAIFQRSVARFARSSNAMPRSIALTS